MGDLFGEIMKNIARLVQVLKKYGDISFIYQQNTQGSFEQKYNCYSLISRVNNNFKCDYTKIGYGSQAKYYIYLLVHGLNDNVSIERGDILSTQGDNYFIDNIFKLGNQHQFSCYRVLAYRQDI